jgi:hypothetical protein
MTSMTIVTIYWQEAPAQWVSHASESVIRVERKRLRSKPCADMDSYWRLVLHNILNMDTLGEIQKMRVP